MKRLLLLVPAVGCFVAAAQVAPVQAEEGPGSGFFGYTLTASSQGFQLTEDEPSANSHPEAEADVPHSQVSLTSGPVGYALSSIAWPGALVGNAGSLVLLVQPGAPPQVAALNDPVRAEARSGSAQQRARYDDVPGTHLEAEATSALTRASALTNGGDAGATIGFGRTTSDSVATLDPASAKVTADSSAKDIALAEGAVTIGSVVSHAEGVTDGATAAAKGRTTVHDMRIAGVPVTADEDGVTVASQHGGIDPVATQTVNTALSSLGMTIALSSPTQAKEGGTVSYDAGSLIVLWKPPGSSNTFTASLGGARVVAGASRSGSSVVPPPLPVDPTTGGLAPAGGGTAPGASLQGRGVPAQVAHAPAPAVPAVAGAVEPLASGTPAPRWSVVLTLLGALLALGGLWRVPGLVLVEPLPVRCPLEEDVP